MWEWWGGVEGGGNNASEDLDEKSTCLYTRAGRKPRGHKKHRAFSLREGGGALRGEGGSWGWGGGWGRLWGAMRAGRTREDHTLL